jgi:hypothetical protein
MKKFWEFDCLPADKVVRYKNRPDLKTFYKRVVKLTLIEITQKARENLQSKA